MRNYPKLQRCGIIRGAAALKEESITKCKKQTKKHHNKSMQICGPVNIR